MTFPDATPYYTPNGGAGGGPPGPPGPPGTMIIVPNEAAASALAPALTPDGTSIFILSHRSEWISFPTSTIALVAHEVIARAGGGVLQRTSYSDPAWRDEITDVYIDELNLTGVADDENKAIFNTPQVGAARLPLLTSLEFQRRWGRRERITADPLNGFIVVHYISGAGIAGAPNELELDCVFGNDTFPSIVGENPIAILGPVALTAFTAQNPAVPAPGGTPSSIQIGATVWGPFIGKRIRRISDGSVAGILKDLGGGVARISQPQITGFAVFGVTPTNVNWAPGDDVVVEDLTPVLWAGHQHFSGESSTTFQFSNLMQIIDLHLPVRDFQTWAPLIDSTVVTTFYQCTIDQAVSLNPPWTFITCISTSIVGGTQLDGKGGWFGGANVVPPTGSTGFLVSGQPNDLFGVAQIDFDTYIQNTVVIARSTGILGAFSVWDTPVLGIVNPGGHAILIGGTASTSITALGECAVRGPTPIFGTGAAGKGMRIGPGSRLKYVTLPNVTGAGGDLQLGDAVLGQWGDIATGTYQPPGGAALSWAALAAAAGLAGFGGSAHNIDRDAHILKASPT